jgi:hypothetical protein
MVVIIFITERMFMNYSRFLAIMVKNITNVWNYFWNQQEMEENAGDMYGKRVNLIIPVGLLPQKQRL